jgi:hypothetical protein
VFVTKLDRNGSALLYSTYLGGSDSDRSQSIAVDENGHAYVTGTARAFQRTYAGGTDGFVTKLNRSGSGVVYATYLGGSFFD